jgi:HlyD family secretion protein
MRSISSCAAVLLFLAIGAGFGAAGYHYCLLWYSPPAAPVGGTVTPQRLVTALGRIEPAAGIVTIGSPVPDRLLVLEKGVKEGETVHPDQPLAELASRAERQLEYDLVCQQIKEGEKKKKLVLAEGQRKIQLEELRKKQLDVMQPLEIALQKTRLNFLKSQVENARKNRDRLKDLSNSIVSQEEREKQALLVKQAEMEHASGRDALLQLTKGGELKLEMAQAQIEAAQAELDRSLLEIPLASLEQQKALAERRLEQTLITAPSSGVILKISARPGELVGGQKPILQIADTRQMVVTAEVYETDIDKVTEGQSARVWSRAWPKGGTGKVTSKGRMIARNRVVDTDPTANVDRRVVEVTVALDQPSPADHMIYHQVYVEISLEKQ